MGGLIVMSLLNISKVYGKVIGILNIEVSKDVMPKLAVGSCNIEQL